MTSYVTRAQLEARFGQTAVAQVSFRDELDADQVIAAAIAGAGQVIDGYVGTRYDLPLSPVPELVNEIAIDIAWYKLWRNGIPDDVAARFKDAQRMLSDIQAGRLVLPGLDGKAPPQAASTDTQVIIDDPGRIFDRDSLEGW